MLASPPVWPLYLLLAGWFSMRALPLLSMAPCPVGELMRSCVGACQGNDASNEFFLALAKENSSVAAGEYYRCVQALTFLPYLSHTLLSRSAHLTTPTAPEGSQEEMLLRITHLTTPTAPEGSQDEVQAPEVACRAGRSPTRARRLLTATTLHAGLLHLGLNCAALASVGPEAEAVLGYAGFATVPPPPSPTAVSRCQIVLQGSACLFIERDTRPRACPAELLSVLAHGRC